MRLSKHLSQTRASDMYAMINACKACKSRKVKCDGKQPRCTPCVKSRKSLDCGYELPKSIHKVLYKGEACLPCRRSKRRCDATRPSCSTCRRCEIEHRCVYETTPSEHRRFQRDSEGNLHEIAPVVESSDASSIRTQDGDAGAGQIRFISDGTETGYLEQPEYPSASIPDFQPTQQVLLDEFILPSLGIGTDPYGSALSGVSLDDLNMIFRLYFFSRRLSYGVYFSVTKQQAILFGDLSNTVIHEFYVHFANLAGCQFYQELRGEYNLLPIQAVHLHLTIAALGTMQEEDNPLSYARAHFFLGLAYGYTQNFRRSMYYHRIAVDVIRRNEIRFVPISKGDDVNSLPESLEEVHERAGTLAHMVHLAVYLYLLGKPDFRIPFHSNEDFGSFELPQLYSYIFHDEDCDQSRREMSWDLETQFRDELPNAYPILFQICPIMLHTRSMILAKDASNLVRWFLQENGESAKPPALWYTTCHIYLNNLLEHIADLTNRLNDGTYVQDAENTLSLRYSIIISYTTLTQIIHTMARGRPIAELPSRNHCSEALRRILVHVGELSPHELKAMDHFISTYWSHTIALVRQDVSPPACKEPQVSEGTVLVGICASTVWPTISSSIPEHEFDFEANLLRLAMYNEELLRSWWLHGTTSLCEAMATENLRRELVFA